MSVLSYLRLCFSPAVKTAKDRRGITALEYGLAAALVALVVIGGAKTFGTNVSTMFKNIGTSVNGVSTSIP